MLTQSPRPTAQSLRVAGRPDSVGSGARWRTPVPAALHSALCRPRVSATGHAGHLPLLPLPGLCAAALSPAESLARPPRSGGADRANRGASSVCLAHSNSRPSLLLASCSARNSARAKSRAAPAAAWPARPEPREVGFSVRTAPSMSVLGAMGQSGSLAGVRVGVDDVKKQCLASGRCSPLQGAHGGSLS